MNHLEKVGGYPLVVSATWLTILVVIFWSKMKYIYIYYYYYFFFKWRFLKTFSWNLIKKISHWGAPKMWLAVSGREGAGLYFSSGIFLGTKKDRKKKKNVSVWLGTVGDAQHFHFLRWEPGKPQSKSLSLSLSSHKKSRVGWGARSLSITPPFPSLPTSLPPSLHTTKSSGRPRLRWYLQLCTR